MLLEAGARENTSLYYGILLKEWLCRRGRQLTVVELLLVAQGHLRIWLRNGVSAEEFHLHRARALFEQYLEATGSANQDAKLWLDYCRVLMFLGDNAKAKGVLQMMVSTFEMDPDLPNYYFYAGAALMALEEYDQAVNYFFEAIQIGPPKFFSKMEMMIIISRNLEKMKTKNEDVYDAGDTQTLASSITQGDGEEAYKMVRFVCPVSDVIFIVVGP